MNPDIKPVTRLGYTQLPMGTIKKRIGKRNTIYVNGVAYHWNTIYHVYNSSKDFSQLQWQDLPVSKRPF